MEIFWITKFKNAPLKRLIRYDKNWWVKNNDLFLNHLNDKNLIFYPKRDTLMIVMNIPTDKSQQVCLRCNRFICVC